MKIFVSYSRKDAGDFAEQIQKYLPGFNYDVFTDTKSINVGDIWTTTIEENISKCDFFVVIITYGALQSPHVENEVLQAQREDKKIIPCIQKDTYYEKIKWDLRSRQGIEFDDRFDLARKLYFHILKMQKKNYEEIINKNIGTSSYLTPEIRDYKKDKDEGPGTASSRSISTVKEKNRRLYFDWTKKKKNTLKILMPVLIVSIIGFTVVFHTELLKMPQYHLRQNNMDITKTAKTLKIGLRFDDTVKAGELIKTPSLPSLDGGKMWKMINGYTKNGIISDFNTSTGKFTYKSNLNYKGSDSVLLTRINENNKSLYAVVVCFIVDVPPQELDKYGPNCAYYGKHNATINE